MQEINLSEESNKKIPSITNFQFVFKDKTSKENFNCVLVQLFNNFTSITGEFSEKNMDFFVKTVKDFFDNKEDLTPLMKEAIDGGYRGMSGNYSCTITEMGWAALDPWGGKYDPKKTYEKNVLKGKDIEVFKKFKENFKIKGEPITGACGMTIYWRFTLEEPFTIHFKFNPDAK